VTAEPKGKITLAGSCECIHLACGHARGQCPEKPVVVEKQLGTLSSLCDSCAAKWGIPARKKPT